MSDREEQPSAIGAWVTRLTPWSGVVALLVAIVVSAMSAVPKHLPGIALDSDALFYLERAAVVIAAMIAGFGLLGNALLGNLPIGFSTTGLTYADQATKAARAAKEANETVVKRVDELEVVNHRAEERMDKVIDALAKISSRA